ncbi:MAG: elongation factor Ts [Synergistaceae bacterium]|nr:elongation factor Ts [Synergistaceae bacterium]
MAFTATDVKNLREMTGCGMMDCKKALAESDGNVDKAIEYLREKGLASQAKKAGRIAAEGMAYAAVIDGVGVVVEVNCETDFVANGELFQGFVKNLATVIAREAPADVDALMNCAWVDGKGTVSTAKDEVFLALRENMNIRRFARMDSGVSVSYVHMKGKIGVLVNLQVEGGIDATEIGKDVAMQIAALNPRFWDKSQVTDDVIEEEKKIMLAQMDNDEKMANKPLQVKEKIVMGKLNKFYSENCLLQQTFVKDGDVTVEQYMERSAKALGGKVAFIDAVRFERGEGIEKKQEDVAAEIATLAGLK